MALLSALPRNQRVLVGEPLSVSVKAADGVALSWWRDGHKVTDGDTLSRSEAQTDDAGTYVVRAVKGAEQEIHGVRVDVTSAGRTITVDLPRKWHGGLVFAVLVLTVLVGAALAAAPVLRAVRLARGGGGRPDAAMIAQTFTAAGVVLLLAGVFVGVTTAVTRARADASDAVQSTAVDPATVAKVVTSLDRPRLPAVLIGAGLLLLALAAVLAWRVAGASPPQGSAAGGGWAVVVSGQLSTAAS